MRYGWNGAFTVGMAASASLFCVGVWVILFGGASGRRSKRTGADKRTSEFLFPNVGSARHARKESREKEKEKRRSGGGTKVKSRD